MAPERYQEINRLCRAALELEPAQRAAYLAEACGDDEALYQEVASLLAYEGREASLLNQRAWEVAARALIEEQHSSLAALPLKQRIGHCQLLELLGRGGMGEVWLAEDTQLNRKVAVKLLPDEFTTDAERVRRFRQEARAASALNHPNILTIHEIGADENTHYIITEYVAGETLRTKFKQGKLPVNAALDVALQVAQALVTAHEAGIIHRDIKPENVMLRRDGIVKVLDFGLAKLTEPSALSLDSQAALLLQQSTSPGLVMGTPGYMSPEQARGEKVDARTDIFCLGVVLYEMVAGRAPFAGATVSEVIAAILRDEPAPLPDAVPELQRIIQRALQKERAARYPAMRDLLADLRRLQRQWERQDEEANVAVSGKAEQSRPLPAASADRSPSAPQTQARRRRLALAGLLMLAVGLFGLFGSRYLATNDQQINSVAVLPFVNASGNADVEYLSDGMTETLISRLAQLPKLNVKARSSVFRYKGKETNPTAIGKELNVQAVLIGRVVQRGEQLTLSLELVDVQTENVLWSEQYQRQQPDLVVLQSEIARDVASQLKLKLSGAEAQKLTKNDTGKSEAYRLYLQGRYYWLRFPEPSFEKSRVYYEQAIKVDPNYALAYAGLSEYHGFGAAVGLLPPDENWAKSEAAANKALALDDTLPDAYNARAGVKQSKYDRAGAERDLQRAIELNPNYAEGRAHYALFLSYEYQQFEESLAQHKKVLELEPLSVRYNSMLVEHFYLTRAYNRALEQCRRTLDLEPNNAITHELLGSVFEQKGMFKEAIVEWSKALTLMEDHELAQLLGRTYAASDFPAAVRALWQKRLARLNARAKGGAYVPAMYYALAYTRLADKDQAFAWLAKAEHERNGLIWRVRLDPVYDPLRTDPRYETWLKRVGFSQ